MDAETEPCRATRGARCRVRRGDRVEGCSTFARKMRRSLVGESGMVSSWNQQRVGTMRSRNQQVVGAAHHLPVIFVSGSTSDADLIVAAVAVEAGPSELVLAALSEKFLQEIHRVLINASRWMAMPVIVKLVNALLPGCDSSSDRASGRRRFWGVHRSDHEGWREERRAVGIWRGTSLRSATCFWAAVRRPRAA